MKLLIDEDTASTALLTRLHAAGHEPMQLPPGTSKGCQLSPVAKCGRVSNEARDHDKRFSFSITSWDRFQKAARERGRSPVRLLTNYMRERLEVWEDQQLDQEIRRDAAHSGYREEDAVAIVRQYRRSLQ